MSGTLRQARILSSETDNTIQQTQETNVNINIKPPHQSRESQTSIPSQQHLYPQVPPLNPNVNFIPRNQPLDPSTDQTSSIPITAMEYQSPYPHVIDNEPQNTFHGLVRDRGIADLGSEIDNLEKKNRFLEMLVEMYENNPLKVNSYVVCESRLLMEMIKLLTDCEKVDLILDDDISCGGCCVASSNSGKSDKIIYVSRILITINGKSEDLKYSRNDIYSQFIKYGISMKMIS